MKLINKTLSLFAATALLLTSCEKAEELASFANGTATVLSSPTATVAPIASDSNKVSAIFNWTDPKYAQDPKLYKFVIEIDSTTRNFTRAYTRTVIGKLTDSIIAKDLNKVMLAWGFEFNKAYDLDVRVTSSYGNNNEQYKSNTIKIKATPYKIPPKIPVPTSGKLFIVGGATVGGWNNPVPAPAQELALINETTFGGVFQLTAGEKYLLLPVNGNWGKYGVDVAASDNLSGTFKAEGGDIPAPAVSGFYKMTIDFQNGRYMVEPITLQHGLPSELFMVGGATPGGWNNPVPVPSQKLTRLNSVWFDVRLALTGGEKYLLLPTNGSWDKKFGVDVANPDNKSGTFKAEGGDIPAPASGTYDFRIDFYSGKYTLK
jgi:starch-binding outer membrane protein SusE/F